MSLFAVATVFNMNIAEQGNAGDVSLDAIEVMAKAEAELPTISCDRPWKVCVTTASGRVIRGTKRYVK